MRESSTSTENTFPWAKASVKGRLSASSSLSVLVIRSMFEVFPKG